GAQDQRVCSRYASKLARALRQLTTSGPALAVTVAAFLPFAVATTAARLSLQELSLDASASAFASRDRSRLRSDVTRVFAFVSARWRRVRVPTLTFVFWSAMPRESRRLASWVAWRVRALSARLRSAITTRSPPTASSATTARRCQSSARPLFDIEARANGAHMTTTRRAIKAAFTFQPFSSSSIDSPGVVLVPRRRDALPVSGDGRASTHSNEGRVLRAELPPVPLGD